MNIQGQFPDESFFFISHSTLYADISMWILLKSAFSLITRKQRMKIEERKQSCDSKLWINFHSYICNVNVCYKSVSRQNGKSVLSEAKRKHHSFKFTFRRLFFCAHQFNRSSLIERIERYSDLSLCRVCTHWHYKQSYLHDKTTDGNDASPQKAG